MASIIGYAAKFYFSFRGARLGTTSYNWHRSSLKGWAAGVAAGRSTLGNGMVASLGVQNFPRRLKLPFTQTLAKRALHYRAPAALVAGTPKEFL